MRPILRLEVSAPRLITCTLASQYSHWTVKLSNFILECHFLIFLCQHQIFDSMTIP